MSTRPSIISIASTANHTVAIRNDGTVWAWGYNWIGQLGDGTTTDRLMPLQVIGLGDKLITSITTGAAHTVAICDSGIVWAWGGG